MDGLFGDACINCEFRSSGVPFRSSGLMEWVVRLLGVLLRSRRRVQSRSPLHNELEEEMRASHYAQRIVKPGKRAPLEYDIESSSEHEAGDCDRIEAHMPNFQPATQIRGYDIETECKSNLYYPASTEECIGFYVTLMYIILVLLPSEICLADISQSFTVPILS